MSAAAPDARIPIATYRLQLGPPLTFDDAARLLPYLAALGISDCYTSPFFESASAESHGYDVCDHNRIREELGGEAGFRRFADALRRHRMGLLIDVVPNHMGIARNRNAWWMDVLENGPASPYAGFFDIDWTPVKPELAGKVLLPILGDHYGAVLDGGQLRLDLDDGWFRVRYHDTVLPIALRSYRRILGHRIDTLPASLGATHPGVQGLKSAIAWFATLPSRAETDPDRLTARRREREIGRQKLVTLLEDFADVRTFVEDNVRVFNGAPGDPHSFDLLDGLLQEQAYRLAFWRVAGEEINYRRFFDVNELAAIRMEDPTVFAQTHRLIFRLVGEGLVSGLRVDHPDGLYEPAEYLRRLQRGCFLARTRGGAEAVTTPDAEQLAPYEALARPGAEPPRPFYIVAEKILAAGERLPENWAVYGTTGYEFLNTLNGIFVDRVQARAMDQLYTRLLRERPSFAEIVYQSKRLIMETSMASELNVLGHRLNVISEKHRSSRDFTLGSLTHALREIIASFPVYRTYMGESDRAASERDRESIARAVTLAKGRALARNLSIYDWIHRLLVLEFPEWCDEAARAERRDFVMRFQQTTGPVTAKGYEDTAFYRYHRLTSLNEVGGDPSRFGTPLAEFHAGNAARQQQYPHGLSATSTHDTKRSEDVRARINVLSDIPGEWRRRVGVWQRLNRRHRAMVDGRPVPGPNEEYLIYQTLVGAWPISVERLREYLFKATHEAKVSTSWISPNARYDEALTRFAEAILDRRRSRAFLEDFTAFQTRVAALGVLNSLAQVLIKTTAPGVPDFYQGTELWDLSLVDPDNRRPVDWAWRRQVLDELGAELDAAHDLPGLARRLLKTHEDGRVKMFLTRQALAFRHRHPALFADGEYRPLEAAGPLAEHVCAFARVAPDAAALTVVPRLLAARGREEPPLGPDAWPETTLVVPAEIGARFRNVLTGERLPAGGGLDLGAVFASFPVALLEREA